MTREELRELLQRAPHVPGTRDRLDYLGAKTGQLFGWIAGPDQQFLCDWLPGAALAYPRPAMRIVEVGTFAGSTARGLIVMTGGGQIICIDNMSDVHQGARGHHVSGRAFWEDTIAHNGTDLSEFATLIEGESADIGAKWDTLVLPHYDVDLLFIDGDHAEEPAFTDLRLYCPHVVVGGYCLVDDMDMPAVERACARYFDTNPRWRITHNPAAGGKIRVYQRISE